MCLYRLAKEFCDVAGHDVIGRLAQVWVNLNVLLMCGVLILLAVNLHLLNLLLLIFYIVLICTMLLLL